MEQGFASLAGRRLCFQLSIVSDLGSEMGTSYRRGNPTFGLGPPRSMAHAVVDATSSKTVVGR